MSTTKIRGLQANTAAITLPKFFPSPLMVLNTAPERSADVNFIIPQKLSLYTADLNAIVLGISFTATHGANITTDLVFSVGTNINANNIFLSQVALNFRQTDHIFTKWLIFQQAVVINIGDTVILNIITGASGNANAILMGSCDLIGFAR